MSTKSKRKYLLHVRGIINYWAKEGTSPQAIAEGVAFSMLVALDGEALGLSPFAVRPINTRGKEGADIAGGLHEELHRTI
jgi:hypothetical protein